ncbi:MAG: DNA-directed RNA polymerase subunit alpha [Candidatus Omnitrophica bacterium]|nr:DNA-directed RNA polymerase subunit alpha [Candidatus Omnitrophota bacterium]
MGIRWKTFEMPKRLELDKATATPTYGKFVAEPFERGYGTTVGNALRRVLISSIEGAAVTSIKVNGMLHEFSTIDGVYEDGAQIVLNIKKLVLRYHGKGVKQISINVKKEGPVLAKDIQTDESVEVVNHDLLICTLTKEVDLKIEMEVGRGRGYVSAEKNKKEGMTIGVIPIDSIFSPVVKVNFKVEDTRVGQITDYDRLILELWTNGAMSPEEALLYASNILARHLDIFVNYGELPEEEEEEEAQEDESFKEIVNKPISELELSVRSANCLEAAQIKTIGDLIQKSEGEMLKYKNFGKKSLSEIAGILTPMGLSLGMNIEERLKGGKAVQADPAVNAN